MAESMGRFSCAYFLCFYLMIGFKLQGPVSGIEYAVAITGRPGGFNYIHGTAEEKEGWIQLKTSRQKLRPLGSASFSIGVTSLGVENKSVVVSASDTVTILGSTTYSKFYIFPISALGIKYIVSSCHPSREYTSVLVIATHSQRTGVDITFRVDGNVIHDGRTYSGGDVLGVSLEEYQTLTLRSSFDLSGTIVSSANSVAVFSGTWYNYECVCHKQLLSVKHYGQEYVVAVDDKGSLCELQIFSEDNDTLIMFNNGSTFPVGDRGIYRRTLGRNESLFFNATRPVMATLCKDGKYSMEFLVLTPVYSFTKQAFGLPTSGLKKILIEQNATEADLKLPKFGLTFPVEWENIPGADYKVGTFSSHGYHITISFNANLSVLVYQGSHTVNPGITYFKVLETTTSTASSRSLTSPTLTTSARNHTQEGTTTSMAAKAETRSDLMLIIAVGCIVVTLVFFIVVTVLICFQRRRMISLEKVSTHLQRQYHLDQTVSSEYNPVNGTNTVTSSNSTYLTIQDINGAENQGPAS